MKTLPNPRTSHTDKYSRSLIIFLLCLFAIIVLNTQAVAQPASDIRQLQPDQAIERTLKGGETHIYQINLKAGQFIHAEVNQSAGFDLIVSLFTPDGQPVIEMNAKDGYLWREAVSCLAASSGVYKLEIKTAEPNASAGSYKVKLDGLREPNEQDRKRIAAEQAFSKGRGLYLQGGQTSTDVIKHYQAALNLWREIGDKYWEAVTLTNLGWTYNDLRQNDKATESLSQALKLFQEVKDRIGEGKAANGLGYAYYDLEQYEKAKYYYEQALAIRRELKDRRGEGNTLNNLGNVYFDSKQYEKARGYYEQALVIKRELKDRIGEGTMIASLGDVHKNLNQYERARDSYEQLLTISRELKNRQGEGIALNALGLNHLNLRQFDKAQTYFEQALLIARELKDKPNERKALFRLGLTYLGAKREQARDYFEQALVIDRELKNRNNESQTLNTLGGIYSGLYQYEKAIDYSEQSLALAREIKDKSNESYALSFLGQIYSELNQADKAVAYLEQALTIKRELKDRLGEAQALTTLGIAYMNLGQYEKARAYSLQGLSIIKELADRFREANTLNTLSILSTFLGNYDEARVYSEQGLAIARELKDRHGEKYALDGLGLIYSMLGKYEKARDYYEESLAIAREVKDRAGEGTTLNSLGGTYSSLSHYEEARTYYEQSLAIAREVKDRFSEGLTLRSLGGVYSNLSQHEQARDYYEQSLAVAREVKNRPSESFALNGLGSVYSTLGQHEKAREYHEQALMIAREVKFHLAENTALISLGFDYANLNQYDKARDYFEQGLAISRELKYKAGQINPLLGFGAVFSDLSQNGKAEDFYRQSLEIIKELKDRRSEGVTLNAVGTTYLNLKQYDKARDYYEQALAIAREVKNKGDEANALINLGEVYLNLNQYEKARNFYEQGLSLTREVKSRSSESSALNGLGSVYQKQNQPEKAQDFYRQALAIAREIKSRKLEGRVLWNLMELNKQKSPLLAVFYGKQAINAFQEIRGNIQRFEKESQQSFLADKEKAYRTLASLLISKGRLPEARQVLDLLKEEEYSRLIKTRGGNGPAKSVPYSTAEEGALKIVDRLATIGKENAVLLAQLDNKSLAASERQRINDRLNQLVTEFKEANKALSDSLKALASTVSAPDAVVRVNAAMGATSLKSDLRGLGAGTVALYTVIAEDVGWIILITPDFSKAYPIDVSGLEEKVAEFTEALRMDAYDPRPLAQELYRRLMQQTSPQQQTTLEADLNTYLARARSKTLMWSLDGVLRYVPMAVLYDGEHYLVERYRNTVITNISLPRLSAPVKPNWKALGLGVSEAKEGFDPLEGAERELHAIIRDRGPVHGKAAANGILPGTIKINGEFTEKAMMENLRDGYPVVHIASHFQYQPTNEEESFLLLGDGSHLTMREIQYNPDIFAGVDLLSLSACETATASAANGKEMEGLGQVAQSLGAKAVIASLWPVDDFGTEELMQRFYRLRQAHPGMTKAEAFQRAQLALLKGEVKAAVEMDSSPKPGDKKLNLPRYQPDPKAPYAHPYYWAPFILIGNWK